MVAGVIGSAAIQELRAGFRGTLIQPQDADYESARKVWNGMINKRPALVARCTGVQDVVAGVRFAREHGLLLAVRGGGHSFPGHSMCDGGLVLDLSAMKGIAVDPAARTAIVEPGVLWSELDQATQEHGLAVPGGQISHTGIAGLTLGGGFGWLSRKFGLTSDNLASAQVVTANGDVVEASATENADLFWGLRGGGGNFGVVTSFRYRLHPLTKALGGLIAWPLPQAGDVLRFVRGFAAGLPDALSLTPALLPTRRASPSSLSPPATPARAPRASACSARCAATARR